MSAVIEAGTAASVDAAATTIAVLDLDAAVAPAPAAATAIVLKEKPASFECPPDLKLIYAKGDPEAPRLISALVTLMQDDDTPITARKVTLLTQVILRSSHAAEFSDISSRAADKFFALLETLRPDAVTDDIVVAMDAALGFCSALGTWRIAPKLKEVMLATLRAISATNCRALCVYVGHQRVLETEMLAAAVGHCYNTLVIEHQPVSGLLLRMIDACLWQAISQSTAEHNTSFVAIVKKCGPSAASLSKLWPYAAFLVENAKTADPITALQLISLTKPCVPSNCVVVIDAITRCQNPTKGLLLSAVAWLDANIQHDAFQAYSQTKYSVSQLLVHMAEFSEEVARALATSGNIMTYMDVYLRWTAKVLVFERLVFWWAQVQWQTNNLPTAKRVLDVMTTFVSGELYFRPVEAPAPFPLDIATVLKFVLDQTAESMAQPAGPLTNKSVNNILRMVFQVAPQYILGNPKAQACVMKNSAELPEICAAIIMAGPVVASGAGASVA
jgi:hypothetical protein